MHCWDWWALGIVGSVGLSLGIVGTIGLTAWLLLHRTRD